MKGSLVLAMKYIHGGDIYTNQIDYDFSVNINPLGMPLKSIAAAHEGIAMAGRYPDYRCTGLKSAIAEKIAVDGENIILGNGAAELIYALCHAVKPANALTVAPTFQEYEEAVKASGGSIRYYMLCDEDEFDIGKNILEHITDDTDILFLCNPNNPTGRLIDYELLQDIIGKCEETGTILCVDESFLTFVRNGSALSVIGKLGNSRGSILVIRSFTKIYGMPGLRLGYMVSNDRELLDKIRCQMQPWNVSIPAQMAGREALYDDEYIEKTLDMTELERIYLNEGLKNVRIKKVYNGSANFIFFLADEVLYDDLYEQGFMIRDCSNMKGLCKGYYRIGIRSHSENQMLVRALQRIENKEL